MACYLEGRYQFKYVAGVCVHHTLPIVVLTGAAIYKWHDDKWHDGKFIKVMLLISFSSFPFQFYCICMGWRLSGNSFYIGIFDVLGCLVSFTSGLNDNYLPPSYQKNIKITLASISAINFGVGFVVTEAPLIFFASIGFLCYIVLLFGEVLGWHFVSQQFHQCMLPTVYFLYIHKPRHE